MKGSIRFSAREMPPGKRRIVAAEFEFNIRSYSHVRVSTRAFGIFHGILPNSDDGLKFPEMRYHVIQEKAFWN